MKVWLQALLRRAVFRYVAVGGSVYVLEVAAIVAAQAAGASGVVAVAIGFWIGLLLSFVLQKFVTFGDKRLHRRVLLPQMVAVAGLVLFNFGFTMLVVELLSPPLPAVVSRTLALGITTMWNFYLYKTRIFKTGEELIY